jgi:hypothetical protein
MRAARRHEFDADAGINIRLAMAGLGPVSSEPKKA